MGLKQKKQVQQQQYSEDEEEEYNEQQQQNSEDDENNFQSFDENEGENEENFDEEEENIDEDEEQLLQQEEEQIKETLKNLPFATLLKLKKQSKEDRQKILKEHASKNKKQNQGFVKEKIIKKVSKDAPMERDARVQVSRNIQILAPKRQKTRDPRFDHISGKLNTTQFNRAYGFLDDMKKNEQSMIKQELKKKKYSATQKQKLKQQLGEINVELKRKEDNQIKQQVKSKFQKNVIDQIKGGQKVHFAKKSEQKEAVLKVKYDKLEKDGKLDKFLDKKRKRHSDKLRFGLDNITKKYKI